MELTLGNSLKIGPEVVFRELDDEAVLLNLKSGIYFGLNPVGTRIWQLISEHGALSQVLNVLSDEFAADRDVLEHDLLELSAELCSRGLAEVGAAS
jgi:hypothetical protein